MLTVPEQNHHWPICTGKKPVIIRVWKGIAQDALIMNVDDLICVGATDNMLMSSTIGRNKLKIPGDVLVHILKGFDETIERACPMGSQCLSYRR